MEIDFKIDGLKEMEKNLLALGADLGSKALTAALRDAAKPIHESMLANVKVGSVSRNVKTRKGSVVHLTPGFLKSRIKMRSSRNVKGRVNRKFGKDDVAMVRVGVFRVGYLVEVEYGTTKAPAQPFIRPALNQAGQSIQIFKGRLAHRINLAAKRLARKK